ncbi:MULTISPECIES: HlyD family secretion protein [unclassified Roseofilum]|uniref:HlyD family secretion protein n=1 Tax=unclassified Roseofilum TaxID=2620099 RepID=UPI001B09E7DE|nr:MULTISPECIES: efflux RND transporter periplasmic adaptor subunit [unclassified Roseofilum]MBP0006871.1 efflux RND transporter periplasmic adaptor subunit [Roseofilum sp. Belize Diploria]MBP0031967.1 efflux RND transporter periplasmic adaptor subunit [Roseofilum sp. Belize BBD 4]
MTSPNLPSQMYRTIIWGLVITIPLVIMISLGFTVLLPALNNPQSRIYFSQFGVPSRYRSQGKPIPVETVSVQSIPLETRLAGPGEFVPLQQVDVRPLVSGPVEKVYVVEGQRVKKGDRLVELYSIPFEERVNQIRNQLAIAAKRQQTLELSAPERIQELEADVAIARSRLQEAQERVEQIQTLAQQEIEENVEKARERMKVAEQKLKQMEELFLEGAIYEFQVLEMQDLYALRQQEWLEAQRGQVIAQDRQFSNQDFYLDRENQLIAAQKALNQARRDFDEQFAVNQLEIETLQLELQEALRTLDRSVIYAETDGLVSRMYIHPGEIAEPQAPDPLMTLAEDMVFKAFIDQAQLNAIEIGDRAQMNFTAYPGKTYTGEVIRVNPTIETQAITPVKIGIDRQYTYSVWIAVDEAQMPPGLQGVASFQSSDSSLVIPESAVSELSGARGMVMVVESGQAILRSIELGRTYGNQREVLDGLTAGEIIVVYPQGLQPGDLLEPIPTSQPML